MGHSKTLQSDINCYAIEAHPLDNFVLRLPNFHILAKREDGIMKAHILDFDLWVFSQDADDQVALSKILERSVDIVMIFILEHFTKDGTINNLYQHRISGTGEWETFMQKSIKNKMLNLEESYKAVLKDPSLLNKVSFQTTINFENLDSESFQNLQEILSLLGKGKPNVAREKINQILAFCKSTYNFDVKGQLVPLYNQN